MKLSLAPVFFAIPLASLFAQTPALEFGVMYECPAVHARLKVFSCAGPAAADWCDVQTDSPARSNVRGKSTRQQVMTLLALCHRQSDAEAKAAASGGPPGGAGGGQSGAGGFKVGDKIQINTAFGWMDAKILQVRGNSYFVDASNGAQVWKSYPAEVRRIG